MADTTTFDTTQHDTAASNATASGSPEPNPTAPAPTTAGATAPAPATPSAGATTPDAPDAGTAPRTRPDAPPPDTEMLDLPTAAELLGRVLAQTARGFLGVDPVTQNPALIAAELARQDARVLRQGDALLGYARNPLQPRQARVATTAVRPEPLEALLGFLAAYHRCTSFTAETDEDSPVLPALAACGFTETGRLPGHVFRSGSRHDVLVHHAVREG